MMKTLAFLLQLLSGANLLLHDGHIATVLCSQSPPAAVSTTPVLLQNAPDVEEQVSIHEGPLLSRARDTLRNVWKSRVSKLPRAKLVTVAAVFVAVAAALASWIRRCAGTRSRLATVRESTNLRRLMASGGSGEGPGDGEDDECYVVTGAPNTTRWVVDKQIPEGGSSQEGKNKRWKKYVPKFWAGSTTGRSLGGIATRCSFFVVRAFDSHHWSSSRFTAARGARLVIVFAVVEYVDSAVSVE